MSWGTALVVALGSALGGVGRVWSTVLVERLAGDGLPWGTFAVNVLGSLLIGLVASLSVPEGRWMAHPLTKQFFLLGLFGGFTTFSSFSLQTVNLLRDGAVVKAAAYVGASAVLCLLAAWLGHLLAVAAQR
ncbi:fluoride efflux transporter CrcB [Rhodovibrio salinarum]|uniref:Fluoride-specific ion channel FluC n=1 Tax=Rhodovibrio salinarum TaxID=1087 RepID=A0A934UYR5_9PROT|nr:fluoride efflux transporter CrcB [Rhodovibrio salinarum]MBK1695711.1 fluoride efflux transporter CrcB [Rhodovibrio salinarum]